METDTLETFCFPNAMDDTLIHQSFNEEDDLRFCAFIDIIRPSHFDNIIMLILKAVGLLLKNTRSIFR